jgi:uncharacterized protein YjcR
MKKMSPSVPVTNLNDNWQAEQDMRTLMDAHKIRADKARHKAAKAHAKRQLAAMQQVATGDSNGQATD